MPFLGMWSTSSRGAAVSRRSRNTCVIFALLLACAVAPNETVYSRDGEKDRTMGRVGVGNGTSARGAARADLQWGASVTPELEIASRAYARRIGVVIGIDEYDPPIARLSSAVSDARAMADALRTIGFDAVFELYDDDASRTKIMELLRSKLSREVGPNDLLVVYFAGHGMRGGDGESYLLPRDSTSDVSRRGLSMQYLKEVALGLEVRAVLYLVDACLSGAIMRRAGEQSGKLEEEYWTEARRSRVVQVISAGSAGESALENRRAGLFSAALRVGLLEGRADGDRDLVITTEELARYTSERVIDESNNRQHPQWGTLEGSGTVLMFDLYRIPDAKQKLLPQIPREEIRGMETEVAVVHRLMEEMRWSEAEVRIRELLLRDVCAELYLLLAEVYLESGASLQGGFKNRALVERELKHAEEYSLTTNQAARLFEIRRVTNRIVRGSY